ncbi:hypothetical protein P7G51_08140 [Enterococcus asini]|uniref:phage tail terminator family protein n=1 Tax=Enterococcus asini TaxID=57732 RepID=UPI00288D92B1|nr:hypothetical protein [Enterococcus asini]MDT2757349.1 hypothetical protein [Enterococcus asini]
MDITAAIANQLLKIEPEATIYREQQEQSFDEPSFYVYEITATGDGEVNRYELRKHTFCIIWFPDSRLDDPGPREQCEIMREKLLDEFQRLDDLSIGVFGKEAKVIDGALQFTFRMRYRVVPNDETPKLETLDQQGGLKRG